MYLTISLFIIVFLYLHFEKQIKQFFKKLKYRKNCLSFDRKVKLVIKDFYEKMTVSNGITNIKVKRKTVIISTLRPGFIIGKKGYLLDELKKTLKSYFGIENIYIKEVTPFR